ncbi:MAG: hypothetical protein V2A74_10880, partial [bacterium]
MDRIARAGNLDGGRDIAAHWWPAVNSALNFQNDDMRRLIAALGVAANDLRPVLARSLLALETAFSFLEKFPSEQTPTNFIQECEEILREFGVGPKLYTNLSQSLRDGQTDRISLFQQETLTLQEFRQLLRETGQAAETMSNGPMPRDELIQFLREQAAEKDFYLPGFESGVQIIELLETRGLPMGVFVAGGLTDEAFPPRPARSSLAPHDDLGRPVLPSFLERRAEAFHLLAAALRNTQGPIRLSYPRQSAGASNLPAIPLEFLNSAGLKMASPDAELKNDFFISREQILQSAGCAIKDEDDYKQIPAEVGLLASLQDAVPVVSRQITLMRGRSAIQNLGPFDGILTPRVLCDFPALDPSGQSGAPLQHLSITALEQYARCPQRF